MICNHFKNSLLSRTWTSSYKTEILSYLTCSNFCDRIVITSIFRWGLWGRKRLRNVHSFRQLLSDRHKHFIASDMKNCSSDMGTHSEYKVNWNKKKTKPCVHLWLINVCLCSSQNNTHVHVSAKKKSRTPHTIMERIVARGEMLTDIFIFIFILFL